jgi:hypothetical protein
MYARHDALYLGTSRLGVVLDRRLGGASPLRALMEGTVSRTARVSGVTRNLKEAVSKVPA